MSPVSHSRSKKSKSKPNSTSSSSKGARRSGNPAVRAEQSAEANLAAWRRMLGAETPEWWSVSAEKVMDAAEGLRECGSALAVEDAVAAMLGAELAERMAAESRGFDLPGWLVRVAGAAADRIADPSRDAVPARLLLYAVAASGTPKAVDAVGRHLKRLGRVPDDEAAAHPWLCAPARSATPTAPPLMARNVYGDRWAVLAPFAIDGQADSSHWYCWDVDACATLRTVSAGVFADADDALAEWRAAVGPSAAEAVPESTGDVALLRELLSEYLRSGFLDGFAVGDEPAELLAEYFRSRNRAAALLKTADRGAPGGRKAALDRPTPQEIIEAADRFAAWCRDHDRGQLPDKESVFTLADSWISADPPAWRYACSPHRIRHTAVLVSDEYFDEHAREILALFPHWVAWCAETTGLDPHHTALALATAHQVSTPERLREIERPEAVSVRVIE